MQSPRKDENETRNTYYITFCIPLLERQSKKDGPETLTNPVGNNNKNDECR